MEEQYIARPVRSERSEGGYYTPVDDHPETANFWTVYEKSDENLEYAIADFYGKNAKHHAMLFASTLNSHSC